MINKILLSGILGTALAASPGETGKNLQSPDPSMQLPVIEAGLSGDEAGIDPIVTGRGMSADYLQRWEANRAAFEECGLCGSEQRFPGD